MSVEDIVVKLAIIQQKRGRVVDHGDVEMLALVIKELRKGRPGSKDCHPNHHRFMPENGDGPIMCIFCGLRGFRTTDAYPASLGDNE